LAFAPGCHPGTGPVKAAAIRVRRACGFRFFLSACTHTALPLPDVLARVGYRRRTPGCASLPGCRVIVVFARRLRRATERRN